MNSVTNPTTSPDERDQRRLAAGIGEWVKYYTSMFEKYAK